MLNPKCRMSLSSNTTGAIQHSAMTWEIEDGQFIKMEKLTKNSQLNDQTFKKWTESVSDEELELFWNVFFVHYFLLESIQWMITTDSLCIMCQRVLEGSQGIWTRKTCAYVFALLLISTRFEVWKDSLEYVWDRFAVWCLRWNCQHGMNSWRLQVGRRNGFEGPLSCYWKRRDSLFVP